MRGMESLSNILFLQTKIPNFKKEADYKIVAIKGYFVSAFCCICP